MNIYITLLFLAFNSFSSDCIECAEHASKSSMNIDSKIIDSSVSLKLMCNLGSNDPKWKSFITEFDKLDNSVKSAKTTLFSYTKPRDIEPRDIRKIEEIVFKNNENTDILKEALKAIMVIELYSQEAYEQNIGTFKRLKNTIDKKVSIDKAHMSKLCMSEQETLEFNSEVFEKSYLQIKKYGVNSPLCSIPYYIHLKSEEVSNLEKDQEKEIINHLYRGLGACMTEEFKVNISKTLLFSKNYVKRILSIKADALTDMTKTTDSDRIVILSMDPIEVENTKSKSKNFHDIYISEITPTKEIVWNTNEKKYVAKINSSDINFQEYLDSHSTPKYDELWKDNKLTTMTLISSNLGSWKEKSARKYLEYYLEQGFTFDEAKDLPDSKEWIEQKVSSGEIDFILKESHTGGNNYDLIGLSKDHKLSIGRKLLSNGKEEVIYILYPQGEEEVRVSFDNFSSWMKTRDNKNKGPLIFLNSSCWSMQDAGVTVASIKSKNFFNIASTSKTTTFFNGENSTKYHIIDGLRNGKNYEEMKKGMATTDRHKRGYNDYIFPFEDRYKSEISSGDNFLLHTIDMFNEDGTPYFLHDAI